MSSPGSSSDGVAQAWAYSRVTLKTKGWSHMLRPNWRKSCSRNSGRAARCWRARPRSLLDNGPLAELLAALVPLDRVPHLLAHRHLQALAISASSYTSGAHYTFYQSRLPIMPWTRSQRQAVPTALGVDHLMASAAIPFVFPSVELPAAQGLEWFGDGSMRQIAPVSPALHLPIFDGGRLRANLRGKEAERDAAIAQYKIGRAHV